VSLKVVIVGDSRLARMSEYRTLTRPRPDFAHVESGHSDEVIANVTEHPPQIAIIDFNMPGSGRIVLAPGFQEPSLGFYQAGG